jgi:hypothetical protein
MVTRTEMLKSGQGKPDTMFEFKADLHTLFLSPLPIGILQTQVFEKLSVTGGQIIPLTTTLTQTIHNLANTIELRNRLIEDFKRSSPMPTNELVVRYFGLPYGGGHVDEQFRSAVDALCAQLDDGIFFSKEICVQLTKHGTSVGDRFRSRFGKGAPGVAKTDFSVPAANGLMPAEEQYAAWRAMFR